MQIDIKIGDFKLLQSGSLVFNQTNNVVFNIEDIEVEFVFIQDSNNSKSVKALTIGNKKVELQITNFDNVLGTAQNIPLNIASLNTGEELYLQYVIYAINEIKILHYSWYAKPGAAKEDVPMNTDTN